MLDSSNYGMLFFSHQFQQKICNPLNSPRASFEVTGQTIAQNLASVPDLDFGAQGVILPLERLRAAAPRVQGVDRKEFMVKNQG
jgi:hypothetical protein